MFSVQTKAKKAAFSNSSGLKSVFEKLHFVNDYIEIKLRLQIPPAYYVRCLKKNITNSERQNWFKVLNRYQGRSLQWYHLHPT